MDYYNNISKGGGNEDSEEMDHNNGTVVVVFDQKESKTASSSAAMTGDLEKGKESTTVGRGRRCGSSKQTRLWLLLVAIAATIVIVVLPCYFLLIASSDDDINGYAKLSREPATAVIATFPATICNEWIPGQNGGCAGAAQQQLQRGGGGVGGGVCNLLAMSMINTTVSVDVALINAGLCREDLASPELTARDIRTAIRAHRLAIVDVSGTDLATILQEAAAAAFGTSGDPELYPYAAGLRYIVEANSLDPDGGDLVSNIEVNRGMREDGTWKPIDPRRFYRVATTVPLASGSVVPGYPSFGKVIREWKTELKIETVDAFYNYAKNDDSEEGDNEEDDEENNNGESDEGHHNDESESESKSDAWWKVYYSTQHFVGENEEPTLAVVPARICHADVPGRPSNDNDDDGATTGRSRSCSPEDVSRGGGVCNLVSWALYDQTFEVDAVILKSGVCAGDIEAGKFAETQLDLALSSEERNRPLVTLDLSGVAIRAMIEEGVAAAIENGVRGAYPYSAGLRFDVDAAAAATTSSSSSRASSSGGRVSGVQIRTPTSGRWVPIASADSYRILTTSDLARGDDPSYPSLAHTADAATIRDEGSTVEDKLVAYATEWGSLYAPPEENASTQSYA